MAADDDVVQEEKGGEGQGKTSDGEQDPRLYSVRISRATGIDWGSDISFSWIYVRDLTPSGAAANCREISVGDQVPDRNTQVSFGHHAVEEAHALVSDPEQTLRPQLNQIAALARLDID